MRVTKIFYLIKPEICISKTNLVAKKLLFVWWDIYFLFLSHPAYKIMRGCQKWVKT